MTRPGQTLVWIVAAALPLTLAIANWTNGPGYRDADYAHYLLHARALAEGRGYSDIGYIYTEANPIIGPRAYPPALPLLIAPVFALAGEVLPPVKLMTLAIYAAFILTAGLHVARTEGPLIGASVTLLVGLSPTLARLATWPVSDILFCLLTIAIVRRLDDAAPPRAAGWLAVALAGCAAIACRSVGVALIPAILAHGALHRKTRGLRFLFPAAAWVASFAAINVWLPIASSYKDQMTASPLAMLRLNLEKLYVYRIGVFEGLLYPFPADRANDVYHVVAGLVAIVGLGEWLRRSWRSFYVVFALTYFAVTAPYWIASERYLWPFLPLLILGLANGMLQIARRIPVLAHPGAPERAAAAACVLIAIPALTCALRQPHAARLDEHPSVRRVFEIVSTHAGPPRDRAVFFNPRVFTWHTRVPAMGFVPGPPGTVLEELRQHAITLVVEGDLGTAARGAAPMREAIAAFPDRFHLVFGDEALRVFRFVDAPPGDEPEGADIR